MEEAKINDKNTEPFWGPEFGSRRHFGRPIKSFCFLPIRCTSTITTGQRNQHPRRSVPRKNPRGGKFLVTLPFSCTINILLHVKSKILSNPCIPTPCIVHTAKGGGRYLDWLSCASVFDVSSNTSSCAVGSFVVPLLKRGFVPNEMVVVSGWADLWVSMVLLKWTRIKMREGRIPFVKSRRLAKCG